MKNENNLYSIEIIFNNYNIQTGICQIMPFQPVKTYFWLECSYLAYIFMFVFAFFPIAIQQKLIN